MQVKKQQLELDMEQRTAFKLGKECDKALYFHPVYLTYMQSKWCKMPGWMKNKLKSRLLGEISITSDTQIILSYGRKRGRMKEPLDERERGEWKSWLKTQHSENKDHRIRSHHFMANRETVETVRDVIFLAPKSLQMVTAAMELKDLCSLEEKLWST